MYFFVSKICVWAQKGRSKYVRRNIIIICSKPIFGAVHSFFNHRHHVLLECENGDDVDAFDVEDK